MGLSVKKLVLILRGMRKGLKIWTREEVDHCKQTLGAILVRAWKIKILRKMLAVEVQLKKFQWEARTLLTSRESK